MTTPAAQLSVPEFSAPAGKFPGFSRSENPRFTLDGSDALEDHLARTCQRITAGVRNLLPRGRLEALLLGGGYGRGEGGVLRTPAGDRPYNDLEFYVFLAGNRHVNERRFGRALHVLGEILTPQAGVDVEFKIASLRELSGSAVSMYSYDLLVGHRLLAGQPAQLDGCGHHRDAAAIPLEEATRLLMNRCTGLLLAKELLEKPVFTGAAADFVGRNIAKAELALGDAMLVAFGSYHWSARHRLQLVRRLARSESLLWLDAVSRLHAKGVEFKLHPERSALSRDELIARHEATGHLARQVWLWLESRRLESRFATARHYATSPVDKFPATSATRNALVNLKVFGARARPSFDLWRHPRNRLVNTFPLLLWEPQALSAPELLDHLQRELQTSATTFPGLLAAYRAIWERTN